MPNWLKVSPTFEPAAFEVLFPHTKSSLILFTRKPSASTARKPNARLDEARPQHGFRAKVCEGTGTRPARFRQAVPTFSSEPPSPISARQEIRRSSGPVASPRQQRLALLFLHPGRRLL